MIPALPNRAGISTGDRGIKLLESDGFYHRNLVQRLQSCDFKKPFAENVFCSLKKITHISENY